MNNQQVQQNKSKQVTKNNRGYTHSKIPYMTDLTKEKDIVNKVTLGEFLNTSITEGLS